MNLDNHIEKFLNNGITNILNKYNQKNLSPKFYSSIILILTEYLKVNDLKIYHDIIYSLTREIKYNIESYDSEMSKSISLFEGLGSICFSINEYCNSTGNFSKFSNSINKVLYERVNSKCKDLVNKETVITGDYDYIYGISGAVKYLLDIDFLDESNSKNIIKYFLYLTEDRFIDDLKIPIFYLSNQESIQFKDYYPDYYIDFGFAHGLASILLILTRLSKINNSSKLNQSIKKILSIYDIFYTIDNYISYPDFLSLKDYFTKNIHTHKNYYAWCYGSLSILRSLIEAYSVINDNDKLYFYKKNYDQIIYSKSIDVNLTSPCYCHGFAGLIDAQVYNYKDNNNSELLYNIQRNIMQMLKKYQANNNFYQQNLDVFADVSQYYKIEGYKNDYSILTGCGGIMLSLINYHLLDKDFGHGKLFGFFI